MYWSPDEVMWRKMRWWLDSSLDERLISALTSLHNPIPEHATRRGRNRPPARPRLMQSHGFRWDECVVISWILLRYSYPRGASSMGSSPNPRSSIQLWGQNSLSSHQYSCNPALSWWNSPKRFHKQATQLDSSKLEFVVKFLELLPRMVIKAGTKTSGDDFR
jgi:hypothetical protein